MSNPEDDDLTIGATAAPTRGPANRPGDRTPTPSQSFAPGSVIAGRYRLVAMLGRGGMGEVYRADDLTLDHPVALKFLPAGVAADADRLAQFHAELRIARQVSHKNVCRLYDLGDADGRRFLTMEYVDGEDLASLLRRIGRIPQDKAIDIARQLCAGLAAAHERGVLHRDLKPANIMIDGDGNVRIADFGLAVAAGGAAASRAGTPQYMAPELLAGGEPSIKTDIYALGLVLFELFTGRRAYEAKTLNELVALQQSGTMSTPSSVVRDLDPAVERVILRCLERDPALRPASALAVSAALPGGDPLAAALAAGETPSPEMLAAAGAADALPVAKGLAAVGWVIAGLLVLAGLSTTASVPGLVPLDKPPAVLIDRAEQILAGFGYTDKAADSAHDFAIDADYLRWLSQRDRTPRRYEALRIGSPMALGFWYRTSPRVLSTFGPGYKITLNDPPMAVPGMTLVVLDTLGRLQQFRAVPPQIDPDSPPQSPQWGALFAAAGLPMSAFSAVTPSWTPRDFADTRAAWEGPLPDRPDLHVRVEMAAYRGRPVSFLLTGPWTQASRTRAIARTTTQTALRSLFLVTIFAILVGALILAWHHLRTSRADLRGATRLSLWMLGSYAFEWVVASQHVADFGAEWNGFGKWFGGALLVSAIVWVVYLAVEPYVRRFWPDGILGWTRLFAGHIRDPRVGREVLLGCTFGVALALAQMATLLVPPLFGATAGQRTFGTSLSSLLGPSALVSSLIGLFWNQVVTALFLVMALVLLRLVFKQPRLAATAFVLLLTVIQTQPVLSQTGSLWTVVTWQIVLIAAIATMLLRFGLLVLAVSLFIAQALGDVPLTLASSRWWATGSNITLIALVAFVCFGFYASRAGQPLLGLKET